MQSDQRTCKLTAGTNTHRGHFYTCFVLCLLYIVGCAVQWNSLLQSDQRTCKLIAGTNTHRGHKKYLENNNLNLNRCHAYFVSRHSYKRGVTVGVRAGRRGQQNLFNTGAPSSLTSGPNFGSHLGHNPQFRPQSTAKSENQNLISGAARKTFILKSAQSHRGHHRARSKGGCGRH